MPPRSMDVTFRSQPLTIGSFRAETAAVAVERSSTEFAFANASAQPATFTLADLAGSIASAEVGSYDNLSTAVTENAWNKEADAITNYALDPTVVRDSWDDG